MHRNSLLMFERYAKPQFRPRLRVLEIGPDTNRWLYRNLVNDPSINWESVELSKAEGVTYVARSEYEFPMESDTYDIVLSGQVIEHVRKIWIWIREVARVCKPGGLVITICPVNWPHHAHPYDCWRIFPDGMRSLYEEAGLEMELCEFGSLELSTARFALHGRSPYRNLTAAINRAIGRRGVHGRAFDTIAIGRKVKA
jgi:SAM-dependent methyltransferase